MKPAEKVAINTGIQYGRVFITMGISLYTVRLVLHALGAQDYGIFNLVAGVISMFAFFNAAISASTQRFISYHLGQKNLSLQQRIFSSTLLLHFMAAILIVIMLELAGLFFFNGFLQIPANRLHAAVIVYHCMCIAVFFGVISIPFTSLLVAHENILSAALFNTMEIVLRFLAAVFLLVTAYDKLETFGLMMAALSVLNFIVLAFYCAKKYDDCVFRYFVRNDLPLIKEITSFAGWNLFGALCSSARSGGLAILLNLFFGTIVNAAFGIANQIAAQLTVFSVTMLRTINPQIMKSEGANNRKRMLRLSMIASKFGFYLLAVFAIPCIFEMPAILGVWLKDVPANTVVFCSLILTGTLVNQLTNGLQTALQATGKIRRYQIMVGLLLLLNVPLAYLLLKTGFAAYTVLISYAFIELLACALRLYLAKKIAGLSVQEYVSRVLLKEMVPLIAIIVTCFLITHYIVLPFRFLLTLGISAIVFITSIYLAGLCKDEKIILHGTFNTFTRRLHTGLTLLMQKGSS